jgi:hypothetical protein
MTPLRELNGMKRMRKAGITDPVTGKLVPFPYMPRVTDLPAGWRRPSMWRAVSAEARRLSRTRG